MIGKSFSHYKILEKIGQGGMGVVYKAQDTRLDRTVALKFLPPELTRDADARTRFTHEAKLAASLNHPNICTIFEIDEAQGQTFIAMEHVEGQSLKEKIRLAPLKLEQALEVAAQVAEGLRRAHERGVVHRDIKSANIMIRPDGQVKVMDFGLAKLTGRTRLTRTGTPVGTVAYMSPEQARAEDVDHRTDVWSLGVVIYEMVTGQLPFRGDYEPAVVYSILNEEPEPVTSLRSAVPMELERLVRKAVAKDPNRRYQSVSDMLVDLRAVRTRPEETSTPQRLIRAESGRKAIAVLPFASLSDSKEDEYFSDGTTEDIITQLSKIGDLKVISRTSVMSYKNSKKTLKEIGRELGVGAILEGSVRRAGDRVRIVSQLVDAQTDEHIWVETYDRELKDIFAIQSEVAQKIAAALKARLSPEEKQLIEKRPTENLTAYDYYLMGREYYYRYQKKDNENAIELFKKALKLDPSYALACAGLGDAYAQRTLRFGFDHSWVESAIEASTTAISLDAACAEAHKALGLAYSVKGWWRKALGATRRAIELNPNYHPAVANMGGLSLNTGDLNDALKWRKKALALNPRFAYSYHGVGVVYRYLDDHEQAQRWFGRALELQPDLIHTHGALIYMYLAQGDHEQAASHSRTLLSIAPEDVYALHYSGYAELFAGNFDRARERFRKAVEVSSTELPVLTNMFLTSRLGYLLWREEKQDEARDMFDQTLALAQSKLDQGDESWEIPYEIAAINAIQGSNKEAYASLQKAIDVGCRDYRICCVDPLFENIREDEQFKRMMAELKGMVAEIRGRAKGE
ncbi:MAG: protein kinase [Candidatus Eiseniibacteriota bacterium]|nr:MAG: protein kinase [Candidatus Eisenbacteria bacterium]